MTLTLRAKFFLVSIGLIATCTAAADAYLTPRLADQVTEAIRADLFVRARLAARDAAVLAEPLTLERVSSWDALADQLGSTARARVTLIRRDGVVLGDSEVALAGLARLENHAARPEVAQALATGEGSAERTSATLLDRMSYVAVAFRRDGEVAGVARVAEPLRAVDAAVAEARRLVWGGSAAALALALVLSSIAAKRLSSAFAELTETARRMAGGDLSVRARMHGGDEVAQLGRALDRLAASLASTLEELRSRQDLQARILEAMQEGVLVVDRENRIAMVNPALRAMLLLGAEAAGKPLLEVLRHARLHDLLAEVGDTKASTSAEVDVPGLKPRRFLVQASPLPHGEHGILVVFVDVTELRRLESLRREFVANASHELRTPIATVRSAAETLRSGALAEPRAAERFVDIIDRNAQRLQALVQDMLDLSKLESNEFKLRRERVELATVVPIVLGLFRERAEQKGIELEAIPVSALAIEGDPRGVEHVLSNLVDNAVKYCPRGAHVRVSAEVDGDRVQLVVSDDGPGIPAEHLPRIFERFYRVDEGRSRELGGTGLGLSIVKHMVEAMRGTISVRSQVGRGSTFVVSLVAA
ncbi:MAG TPA: ATP-binding protein [Polyangiaceae bacterium]